MVRSDKAKATPIVRSTTAPASAARRAKVADRDAKFIEYIKREDVQAKMADMNPSKRMGFAIKSFKEETDITVPTTMAYRAWHKALGAIKIKKDKQEKPIVHGKEPSTEESVEVHCLIEASGYPLDQRSVVPNVPDSWKPATNVDTEETVLKFSSDVSDNEQPPAEHPLDDSRSPWQAAEHAISEEPATII